jgi:GTPase SAR1 family protein
MATQLPPLVFLVVGEAGKGKSTMIDYFYGETSEADQKRVGDLMQGEVATARPATGGGAKGVTKCASLYPTVIAGRDVILIDMPGIQGGPGDFSKPAAIIDELTSVMESFSSTGGLNLNGILTCVEVDSRLGTGQQLMQEIVGKCCGGEGTDCWKQVIVVGTKKDKCTKQNSSKPDKKKIAAWRAGPNSIMEQLQGSGQAVEKLALIAIAIAVPPDSSDSDDDGDPAQSDVEELLSIIRTFSGVLSYKPISTADLAQLFEEVMNIKVSVADLEQCFAERKIDRFKGLKGIAGALGGKATKASFTMGGGMFGFAKNAMKAAVAGGAAVVLAPAAAVGAVAGGVLVAGALYTAKGTAEGLEKGYENGQQVTDIFQQAAEQGKLGNGAKECAVNARHMGEDMGKFVKESAHACKSASKETLALGPSLIFQIPGLDDDHELCAYLSSIIYTCNNSEELRANLDRTKSGCTYAAQIGAQGGCHSPLAVAVCGSTMFVVWRGTGNVVDMIADGNCEPVSNSLWKDFCPDVLAHAGTGSKVQHHFLEHIGDLGQVVKRAEECADLPDITKVIFTGHSLGGGMAQIALLAALAQVECKFDGARKADQQVLIETFGAMQGGLNPVPKIELSAVVFASPMVFHFPDGTLGSLCAKSKTIMEQMTDYRACNYVFEDDMVPRFPRHMGHLNSALPALSKAVFTQWVQNRYKLMPASLSAFFGDKMQDFGMERVEKMVESMQKMGHTQNYQHACAILFFSADPNPSSESSPRAGMKDQAIAKPERQMLTPEAFGKYSEGGWDEQKQIEVGKVILEHHSVCPDAVGTRLHATQAIARQARRDSFTAKGDSY